MPHLFSHYYGPFSSPPPPDFLKLLETSAALRNKASIFHIRHARLSSPPSSAFYSQDEVSNWPASVECQLLFFH